MSVPYGKAPRNCPRARSRRRCCRPARRHGSSPAGSAGDHAHAAGRRPLGGGELPGRDGDVARDRFGRRPGPPAVRRLRRLGLVAGHQHGEVLGRGDADRGVGGRAARRLAGQVDERVARPADAGLPRQQRGAAGPPGHPVVGAEPVEGAAGRGVSVKSSVTSVDSPAASSPSSSTTYRPPGSAAPAASYPPPETSSPWTSSTVSRCPRAPSRARWAAAGTPARRWPDPG